MIMCICHIMHQSLLLSHTIIFVSFMINRIYRRQSVFFEVTLSMLRCCINVNVDSEEDRNRDICMGGG